MHKNRAKCKKCESVIESFHDMDLVECKCGEITVYGGSGMYCSAQDWSNFLRVDDLGNEIQIVVDNQNKKEESFENPQYDKNAILASVQEMKRNLNDLPSHVLSQAINHYDLLSVLILLESLLRLDCKD